MEKSSKFVNFTGIRGETIYVLAKNVVYFYGGSENGTQIAVMAGEKAALISVTENPDEVASKLSYYM